MEWDQIIDCAPEIERVARQFAHGDRDLADDLAQEIRILLLDHELPAEWTPGVVVYTARQLASRILKRKVYTPIGPSLDDYQVDDDGRYSRVYEDC